MSFSIVATSKALNVYYSAKTIVDSYRTKMFTEVRRESSFNGGFVIVMALFEKIELRRDVVKFIEIAKSIGAFVIGVNTLLLKPESYNSGLFDVYIERDNFGRDFGSYQTGFNYIFDKGINIKCKRIMMINDSVYFSEKGLADFIRMMESTNHSVLGATENHEDIHHIGSFCISFSNKVACENRFISFWREYKRTNVRPKIIKNGEMALTSMLHRVSWDNSYLPVAYDSRRLEKLLQNDEFLRNYISLIRWGGKRVLISKSITDFLLEDKNATGFYLHYFEEVTGVKVMIDGFKYLSKKDFQDELEEIALNDVSIIDFVQKIDFNEIPFADVFRRSIVSLCLKSYTDSSQIHSNCVSLYSMGLPIIKMDLIYRSLASFGDIERIMDMMPDSEKSDFLSRVMSKSAGHSFLHGFKRLSFMHGYI